MTVEVHLMTLVISGLQEFITKMRSLCSLGPVRTELAVMTLHSGVACEKSCHDVVIKHQKIVMYFKRLIFCNPEINTN